MLEVFSNPQYRTLRHYQFRDEWPGTESSIYNAPRIPGPLEWVLGPKALSTPTHLYLRVDFYINRCPFKIVACACRACSNSNYHIHFGPKLYVITCF